MLDLVFSNITDIHINFPDTGMVKPDACHPPLSIEMPVIVKTCSKTSEFLYFKYACGDYILFYQILFSYDWLCVYSEPSVDAAVASLNPVVHEAIDGSIPQGSVTGSNFPSWFSRTLRHYIFKKNKSDVYYNKVSYYRKFVKNTIMSVRSRWLKSIDESLKNNPKKFWNYVSSFRKHKLNPFNLW
jgi:hypothetical protein